MLAMGAHQSGETGEGTCNYVPSQICAIVLVIASAIVNHAFTMLSNAVYMFPRWPCWLNVLLVATMVLPSPLEATSVATRMGALPYLKSKKKGGRRETIMG